VLSCNARDYDGLGTRITLDRPSEVAYAGASPRMSNGATGANADDADDDADDDAS
jgi:hypothetical protein